jgi:hypothetical protein
VEDDLGALHRAAHRVGVAQITLDQLDVREGVAQVGAAPGAEVIEHPHGVAELEQPIGQMATDEAAAAGYERGSHGLFLCICSTTIDARRAVKFLAIVRL